MRIGHGYDVHRFTEGRPLVLGGVTVAHDRGLLGHSDADVLTHAVMDALLGAAALGDIGLHFPDSDPAYRGISSLTLLSRVGELLAEKGYRVGNIDAMREKIAAALGIEPERVSVKATTEEGLGFTGERLGIAAHAVCLLV